MTWTAPPTHHAVAEAPRQTVDSNRPCECEVRDTSSHLFAMRFCKLTRAQLRIGPLGRTRAFSANGEKRPYRSGGASLAYNELRACSPADFFGSLESAQMPPQFLDS